MMILLGWEIGTGKRVEIPDTGHLAWFGQTQLSGKTTALEAIAFRGGLRAVAFITKQGESGFLTGKKIPPYFSEPTNDEEQPLWRWVKSILEASQQRKMNFEESWIIRACEDPRQAKTLLDVHENIKSLLGGEGGYIEKGRGKKKKREWKYSRKPVSGMNAGIYTSLKAYFDIVMPQLARLPYTKKLELHPGLNVMNLQEYAMETQALVIRSVMEWVYQHEKNVRIIVPEAQDFVPQGKNSPVKMACETLVRKAGANKNFMWLDSQDMAAVDKFALRACSIVGIGVQTEMHEIDRSLATMFTPTLKAVDIARLKIGEFFVRTSEARVSKVYVQPAWCDSEMHAQEIAKGNLPVSSLRAILEEFKKKQRGKESRKNQPAPPQLLQIQTQERESTDYEKPGRSDHGTERFDVRSEANGDSEGSVRSRTSQTEGSANKSESEIQNQVGTDGDVPGGEDEPMLKETPAEIVRRCLDRDGLETENEGLDALDKFLAEHKALIEAHDALAERVKELSAEIFNRDEGHKPTIHIEHGVAFPSDHGAWATGHDSNGGHGLSLTVPQLDYIYKYVKANATKDPGILEILTRRPEMRITIEPTILQVRGDTLRGSVALLIHRGFFKTPKNGSVTYSELIRLGQKLSKPTAYAELDNLTELGFLTKEPKGYQEVAEMKVQVVGGRG
jgi:hypothetical protein